MRPVWLNIVNIEFLHHMRRELSEVHPGQLGIALAISRRIDVSAKRIRRHSDPVARSRRKINVRLWTGLRQCEWHSARQQSASRSSGQRFEKSATRERMFDHIFV